MKDTRLLLVEDDRELLEFVKYLFTQEQYEISTAGDGEEALQKARAELPDAILLDVLLPKMHGFEVCQRLRQDPATCLIPIIMVTSLTAMKDRLTGFKLGADQYVSKPFEPVELLAQVERLIVRSRLNQAANPLTGLASGGALEQELKRRLEEREPSTLALGDINHLTLFNNQFGFERGDGLLRLLGAIFRSAIAELGNRNDFGVHFGGDDFAFLSTPLRAEVVAARILENIEELMPMQYDDVSREQGYWIRKNEKGENVREPFLSFSMGLVDLVPGFYQHQAQVFDRARAALADAKKKGGNQIVKLS